MRRLCLIIMLLAPLLVGRYQLLHFHYSVGLYGQETIVRIDTVTGKTWRYDVGHDSTGMAYRSMWREVVELGLVP